MGRVVFGSTAGFQKGVADLARLVQVTYGPRGRNVLVDRGRRRGLLATTDGMTVAGEWAPSEPLPRIAVSVLREAAHKVGTEIGDGTSTTVLLACALYLEGVKLVAGGHSAPEVAAYFQDLASRYIADPWPARIPATRQLLEAVAQQSTKSDAEVSKAIAEACMLAGKYGLIKVEDGKGRGVELLEKQGMEIEAGWESTEFGPRWERESCLVALVAGEVSGFEQVSPILEAASTVEDGSLPVLVVSYGMYGPALQTMVTNASKGVVDSCAVRCPGSIRPKMRPHIEDLAALTGAEIFDPEVSSFESFEAPLLGSIQQVSAASETTTLVAYEERYEGIEARVAQLLAEQEALESSYDRDEMQARIAGLSEGLVVLQVGGDTELAMAERRGRIEDGLSAVRAAFEHGLVPGAGATLLRLSRQIRTREPFSPARDAFCEALTAPLRALCENAGAEPAVVLQAFPEEPWSGYDVVQGVFRDLREEPALLEPSSVFSSSVSTSASVAGMLLTCDTSILKSARRFQR